MAAQLRDLLMDAGVLPAIDKWILHYQRWMAGSTPGSPTPTTPCCRASSPRSSSCPPCATAPPTSPSTQAPATTPPVSSPSPPASWTGSQAAGEPSTPSLSATSTPGTPPASQDRLRGFLVWVAARGHSPRLDVPVNESASRAPISQERRLELLRQALTDDTTQLRDRVVVCLILLYAQPLNRLLRLLILTSSGTATTSCSASATRRHPSPARSPSSSSATQTSART